MKSSRKRQKPWIWLRAVRQPLREKWFSNEDWWFQFARFIATSMTDCLANVTRFVIVLDIWWSRSLLVFALNKTMSSCRNRNVKPPPTVQHYVALYLLNLFIYLFIFLQSERSVYVSFIRIFNLLLFKNGKTRNLHFCLIPVLASTKTKLIQMKRNKKISPCKII